MSGHSRSDSDNSFDADELLQIQARCRELWKEKDLLLESRPRSFELIRELDSHVKSLNDSRSKAKKRIETLEKELLNCSQEIDYLQDQLGSRTAELFSLGKHVDELELKLTKMEDMEVKVDQLSDELKRSNAENLLLIEELQIKDVELQCSALHIRRLEESVCSITLDSQCEIEGMKLDMMALEQACFEARKAQEDTIQENTSLNKLIKELEVQINEKPAVVLERGNIELREKPMELVAEVDSKEQLENKTDYESAVRKLKEELKEVKLRAEEEAEDMAQEMAELRYETTCLLEEERKRRAMVELASTHRIAELESQIRKDRRESVAVVRHLEEA